MTRKMLICSAVLLLASCGHKSDGTVATEATSSMPSQTLKAFGDYKAVSNWKEKSDPIDGPSKQLIYSVDSEDYKAKLIVSCEGGRVHAVIGEVGMSDNQIDQPAEVTLRIDDLAPEKMHFTGLAQDIGLRPGDGGADASIQFLKRISGTNKVAVRFDTVMGLPANDPPMVFKTTGAGDVQHNVLLACQVGAAGAAAKAVSPFGAPQTSVPVAEVTGSHVADAPADQQVLPGGQEGNDYTSFSPEQQSLANNWRSADDRCKGGSGDDPATDDACRARDLSYEAMKRAGVCYGEPNQHGYEMRLHRCFNTRGSN